jgi:hypothetical protein
MSDEKLSFIDPDESPFFLLVTILLDIAILLVVTQLPNYSRPTLTAKLHTPTSQLCRNEFSPEGAAGTGVNLSVCATRL